jgi:hypothetical protein
MTLLWLATAAPLPQYTATHIQSTNTPTCTNMHYKSCMVPPTIPSLLPTGPAPRQPQIPPLRPLNHWSSYPHYNPPRLPPQSRPWPMIYDPKSSKPTHWRPPWHQGTMSSNRTMTATTSRPDNPPCHPGGPPGSSTHAGLWPGNILLQAIHHVMALEAAKVSAQLQWTGPLVNIEDYCFGVVHPITKQTITQYHKLQHEPDLKDLWVSAMSKEINCLAQGMPGVIR